MVNKKTIVFDFDGTLANSIPLMIDLYNDYASKRGNMVLFDESKMDYYRGLTYKSIFKELKLSIFNIPSMILTLSKGMQNRISEVEVYPGIVESLTSMKNAGLRLGLLTSNNKDLVTKFLVDNKFPEFDFVISEKSIFGKDKAMKKMEKTGVIKLSEMIYVGDEPRDADASLKVGADFVAVSWGIGGKIGFLKYKSLQIVHNPSELTDIILNRC